MDNLNKITTSAYKFGMGVEYPHSMLDIKDTSVAQLQDATKISNEQQKMINNIIPLIEGSLNGDDFLTVISNNFPIQTNDSYISVYEIDTATSLSEDCTVIYDWIHPSWHG